MKGLFVHVLAAAELASWSVVFRVAAVKKPEDPKKRSGRGTVPAASKKKGMKNDNENEPNKEQHRSRGKIENSNSAAPAFSSTTLRSTASSGKKALTTPTNPSKSNKGSRKATPAKKTPANANAKASARTSIKSEQPGDFPTKEGSSSRPPSVAKNKKQDENDATSASKARIKTSSTQKATYLKARQKVKEIAKQRSKSKPTTSSRKVDDNLQHTTSGSTTGATSRTTGSVKNTKPASEQLVQHPVLVEVKNEARKTKLEDFVERRMQDLMDARRAFESSTAVVDELQVEDDLQDDDDEDPLLAATPDPEDEEPGRPARGLFRRDPEVAEDDKADHERAQLLATLRTSTPTSTARHSLMKMSWMLNKQEQDYEQDHHRRVDHHDGKNYLPSYFSFKPPPRPRKVDEPSEQYFNYSPTESWEQKAQIALERRRKMMEISNLFSIPRTDNNDSVNRPLVFTYDTFVNQASKSKSSSPVTKNKKMKRSSAPGGGHKKPTKSMKKKSNTWKNNWKLYAKMDQMAALQERRDRREQESRREKKGEDRRAGGTVDVERAALLQHYAADTADTAASAKTTMKMMRKNNEKKQCKFSLIACAPRRNEKISRARRRPSIAARVQGGGGGETSCGSGLSTSASKNVSENHRSSDTKTRHDQTPSAS
ncbi:unnamed protein product [Amoebophrya sp. A120]|nr:unnamed protein product [Amoebophrya sp. A120]|eukprot:GSA120T00000331001.1